jgi:hypothetical protein
MCIHQIALRVYSSPDFQATLHPNSPPVHANMFGPDEKRRGGDRYARRRESGQAMEVRLSRVSRGPTAE